MGRLRLVPLLLVFAITPKAWAQVIECPGALPAAHLQQDQTMRVAERLLGRFIATLDLHGLDAIDEQAILERYQTHPKQLLIKLTYLTLQCQMVLLDQTMAVTERKSAVRRAFLHYVLDAADPSSTSLAAYIADAATNGRPSETNGYQNDIERIEAAILASPRRQWAERWFLSPPADGTSEPARSWSVIIASPRFEDDGWTTLRRYQTSHPDIHFELDGPFDLDSPHYAIVLGRGLTQDTATQLLEQIKDQGLPEDSFIWRAPPRAAPREGS